MRRGSNLAAKLLFAGLASLFAMTLLAAEPVAWKTDPDAAWREAFAAGKPMFLVVSSKNCPACDRLKAGALANPEFRGWVESRFVPAVILAEDHPFVVEKLGVKGYPTTVVVAPKVGVVYGSLGAFNPDDFREKFSVAEATAANPTR